MTYRIVTPLVGAQAIADTSTVQKHPLGTIVRAVDPTYGSGEFIYLLGVGSTLAGSMVTYNATTYQTTLSASTAYQAVPVGFAMSANVASQYGWYQIEGLAVARKAAQKFTPQVKAYAGVGLVNSTASIGKGVVNARSANLTTTTSTASNVTLLINRPFLQGPDNVTTAGA